ncbi:MAG: LytTR family DNA-binding domain-containing protein [Saprospiraceae bacterium]|nr:LytTR family DNA-binding domain-containing protein [Saprospiraceae bacterium]
MLRAILIDDEISCVESLAIELEAYCPDVETIAQCTDAQTGLEAILEHTPDVVFLDIEMPFMNGFELLERLDAINFDVIFVTAYDQYAIRAFDFNATDYLLKPVQKSKLIAAVDKVQRRSERGLSKDSLTALIQTIRGISQPMPNIALPTLEGFEFVKIDDIVIAEADSNYTHIHLRSGKRLILSRTLKEIEALLAQHHFVRVHQSFLINLGHVSKYVKGQGGYVVMDTGQSVNVSRNYKSRLLDLIRK